MVDFDHLSNATNSKRMQGFVNIGQQDFEYPINKGEVSSSFSSITQANTRLAALPTPLQRRSRNELRRLAEGDPKLLGEFSHFAKVENASNELLARLGQKVARKASAASKLVQPSKPRAPLKAIQTPSGIKYESVSSSEESSSEEDSSESDSDDELSEPSPNPVKRPENPLEAVKYDSIKALWRSRRFDVDSDDIRGGLKDYWEVVRTIRDRWKDDTAAVTKAEEKKRIGELPLLKSRVKDQRDMMEVSLKAALEHGHKGILEMSGENVSFLFLLYQFLLDRFKEGDMDGPLSNAALEILATCATLTEQKLEKTHLVKVLPRYTKKGNATTQALVKRIESAAKEGSQKKLKEEPLAEQPESVVSAPAPVKTASANKPATGTVLGVKRSASSNAVPGQPPKKMASTVKDVASNASAKPGSAGSKRTLPASGASKPPNTGAPTAKAKPAVAKPSAFFTGLQATAKKPVASAAAKPAASSIIASAIKSIEEKPVAPATPTATSAPSFSFASTMANLNKPKEKVPSPKAEQKRLPETAEEKQKRLRKEARRSLRVKFRPEGSLVEVKYFTHEPEEDLGHDESMTRDVSDVGGEGRMFKQHKDMADMDEDEDTTGEEELKPYREPGLIDFSPVDKDERDRNFAPFGGGTQQPESGEKPIRDQHEANTLMVFYTDPKDIPPSPKEPVEGSEGDATLLKQFGAPQGVAAERAAKFTATVQPHYPQSTQGPIAPTDISAVLAALNPQRTQAQHQQPTAAGQSQMSEIQKILAAFTQPVAQPATQQPSPFIPQAASQASQPAMPSNLANIFASLQPQAQNVPQNQQSPVPSTDTAAANLAALFSQYGGVSGPPAAAIPNFNGMLGMPFDSTNASQPQPGQQQYPYENEERRRWREGGDDDNSDQRATKKSKSNWNDKRFTQPCKYYKQGKCQKGSKCTYLHTD